LCGGKVQFVNAGSCLYFQSAEAMPEPRVWFSGAWSPKRIFTPLVHYRHCMRFRSLAGYGLFSNESPLAIAFIQAFAGSANPCDACQQYDPRSV